MGAWGGSRVSPDAPEARSPSPLRLVSNGGGRTSYTAGRFRGCPSWCLRPSSPSGSKSGSPALPSMQGGPRDTRGVGGFPQTLACVPSSGVWRAVRPLPLRPALPGLLAQVGGLPAKDCDMSPGCTPACLPAGALLGEHGVFLVRGMTLGYEWSRPVAGTQVRSRAEGRGLLLTPRTSPGLVDANAT